MDTLMVSSPLAVAAVWAPLSSDREVRALLDRIGVLARSRARVELALADVLADLRRRDPAELGHVTWTAFCGEHVDWGGSWVRAMIRLVESPLDVVRRAAEEGVVPLPSCGAGATVRRRPGCGRARAPRRHPRRRNRRPPFPWQRPAAACTSSNARCAA